MVFVDPIVIVAMIVLGDQMEGQDEKGKNV